LATKASVKRWIAGVILVGPALSCRAASIDILESYCEKPILSTGIARRTCENVGRITAAPQIARVMMVFDK